jgi:hypothetical protein
MGKTASCAPRLGAVDPPPVNTLVGQSLARCAAPRFGLVLQDRFSGAPSLGAGGSGGPLCALRRAAPHAKALRMRMMSWPGHRPRSLGPVDFRSKRAQPVIVTEQQADPVELLYKAFQRLDAEQRRRLLGRVARS